jgi:hypothetical protein
MNLDVAQTVKNTMDGLRRLPPSTTAMILAAMLVAGFGVYALRLYGLVFDEMKSQRRDAIQVTESLQKSSESLRESAEAIRDQRAQRRIEAGEPRPQALPGHAAP